ncbi:MAG: hypothetical protein DBX47_04790 [Clostridiales bacterium]|nr:MAG: hypothetical protein DBX47_04790 [Clostridiales bacterium]
MDLKNIKKYFKNNFLMIGYVYKYIPSYIFVHFFAGLILNIAGPVIYISFTKNLFDTIEALATQQDPDFNKIVILFVVVITYQIIEDILNRSLIYFRDVFIANRLEEKMQSILYEKAQSLDLELYDDPEFYNDFCWAMQNSTSRAVSCTDTLIDFISHSIAMIAIFSIILTLDWVAIVVVCIYVLVDYLFKIKETKNNFEKEVDMNPIQRKIDYINRVFFLDTFAKELRLTKVSKLLLKKYDKANDDKKKLQMISIKKKFKLNLANDLVISILWEILFTSVLVFRIVVSGTLTIGGMIATKQAANQVRWKFSKWLYNIKCFRENAIFIDKFRSFMERESCFTPNKEAKDFNEPFNKLELKNVSFTYASKTEPALKNINMIINKNEKIAIVGYNGAGKSTLIKLIMRLYNPQEGEVYLNAKNINEFTGETCRKIFGTVFQDFKLFAFNLAENVVVDEFDSKDENDVKTALKKAGFTNKLSQMPKGIYTNITKEFDEEGAILSGGEMQKIAISRTLAKNYEFIIMDEPSSALDPDSEYELNKLMMNSVNNKTVIFISHRLSTTRMADKIYMMENGEIIEFGSHDELMSLNGKYAEMFNLQAEKYLITE